MNKTKKEKKIVKKTLPRGTFIEWALWGIMLALIWKPLGVIWFVICVIDGRKEKRKE